MTTLTPKHRAADRPVDAPSLACSCRWDDCPGVIVPRVVHDYGRRTSYDAEHRADR